MTRAYHAVALVLVGFAFLVVVVLTKTHDASGVGHFHTGPGWWVLLGLFGGVALGLALDGLLELSRNSHWQLVVRSDLYAARVELHRGSDHLLIASVPVDEDDFDDLLHAAVSRAKAKRTTLEVAER